MTDRIAQLAEQWRKERPDIDVDVMAMVARLLVAAGLIGKRLDTQAAENGLDRGQGDVLFTLRRSGPPYRLSPSALTDSLLVTSGTMTNRLDRLERAGLVARRPNPSDRRGIGVQLTEKGWELTEEMIGPHVASEAAMLEPLSERERRDLVRITQKLIDHLG